MNFDRHDHYAELTGELDLAGKGFGTPIAKAVLSDISHGSHIGTRAAGLGIKYVARGTEYYQVGGRSYAVHAGQFMCLPQHLYHEGEAKRSGERTLGLCIFIPENQASQEGGDTFEFPIVFSAECSVLGATLKSRICELMRPAANRPLVAGSLLAGLKAQLEPLLEETVGALDALPTVKKSTRYENLRRLNLARGYLHEVTDRPVELGELASFVGMSRFQLLRYFRECFGAPPSAYHRQLRLGLAREALARNQMSCADAAHRYGFSDSSSFSHSFRRLFGEAPGRSLSRAA